MLRLARLLFLSLDQLRSLELFVFAFFYTKSRLEAECERASLVNAFGEDIDVAGVELNDVLADHEAHADSLAVHIGRALKLAKLLEQLVHLVRANALASVDHVHKKLVLVRVKRDNDPNHAFQSKLHCVLQQVDHDLLQTHLVCKERAWQGLLCQMLPLEIEIFGCLKRLEGDHLEAYFDFGEIALWLENGEQEFKQVDGAERGELGLVLFGL